MKPLTLFILLSGHALFAQIQQSFDSLTTNWKFSQFSGEDDFYVSDGRLRSRGPAATGEIWASYPAQTQTGREELTWSLHAEYGHNPSATNSIRFVLGSDNADLDAAGSGLALEVGESGSPDRVRFLRLPDEEIWVSEPVIDILDHQFIIHKSESQNWLIVIRNESGTDTLGSFTLLDQNTYSHLGMLITHTSSRNESFFFDDLTLERQILPDTSAPELIDFAVISDKRISLQFTESIDSVSGTLDGQIISQYETHGNRVDIFPSQPFKNGSSYLLGLLVCDSQRNCSTIEVPFEFLLPEAPTFQSVIINEIMSDPSPSIGLPEEEYIELYNREEYYLDLTGVTIADQQSGVSLPQLTLPPHAFLLITADTSQFSSDVNKIQLPLPSLNNSGDKVSLWLEDRLLDSIHYSNGWYSPEKRDGGYSLERINPHLTCSDSQNWKATENLDGGTPGFTNSTIDYSIDSSLYLRSHQVDSSYIRLTLSQPILGKEIESEMISIQNLTIHQIDTPKPYSRQLMIETESIQRGTVYQMEIENLPGCNGGMLRTALEIRRSEQASPGDIVFSEIMADPEPSIGLPAFEYLELFNASNKELNLYGWTINDKEVKENIWLSPGLFILVCIDAAPWEMKITPEGWSATQLSNSGGTVILRDEQGTLIDLAEYENDMYFHSRQKEGGFSLERIDLFSRCLNQDRWKASDNPTGGTPGQPNSHQEAEEDLRPPKLDFAMAISDTSLFISTSEPVLRKEFRSAPFFRISANESFSSEWVLFADSVPSFVELSLSDCHFNTTKIRQEVLFPRSLPDTQLVINEVMFETLDMRAEFIELYNPSGQVLNLQDFRMGRKDRWIGDLHQLSAKPYPLLPGQYLVLTGSKNFFHYFYPQAPSETLKMKLQHNLKAEEDTLVITNQFSQVVEEAAYHQDWHSNLLSETADVSLEKTDPYADGLLSGSWFSASTLARYATPGEENSQRTYPSSSSEEIRAVPEIFIPGESYTDVYYVLQSQDQIGSAKIYDQHGRLIRQLLPAAIWGSRGTIRWDGSNDHGTACRVGNYLFLLEIISSDGTARYLKTRIALATR